MEKKYILTVITLLHFFVQISGHGMMLEPPNRSSLWRFNTSAPVNHDDNRNDCGGFYLHHKLGHGQCGVCGDPFLERHPQENENTGTYGQGKVVRKYEKGSVIVVEIRLTSNHMGYFQYSICKLKAHNEPEPGEKCFELLQFENGSSGYYVTETEHEIINKVKLPDDLECERCTFRWYYTAGLSWGTCENGKVEEGCGPQETFVSCADVAVL